MTWPSQPELSHHHQSEDIRRRRRQDDLIDRAIGFGKFHHGLSLLIFLSQLPVAWHTLAIFFLAPDASYTCGKLGPNFCPCDKPVYDTKEFSQTITMKWHLICDRKWLISFNQTLLQLGALIGSILFGSLSDSYGRKIPLLVGVLIQLLAGVSASYVNEFWLFTFLRFLIGAASGGILVNGFVIIMEFSGRRQRDFVAILHQATFSMGHALMPVIAYHCRHYSIFHMAISLPVMTFILYICLIPESARWLIAIKRKEEAILILETVARTNVMPVEKVRINVETYEQVINSHHHLLKKAHLADLFRTPNLRRNILALSYNWLACGYCFYGVSQYVGHLKGDIFGNVALSGSCAFIGTLAAIPLFRTLGRKLLLLIFHVITVVSLFFLVFIPEGVGAVIFSCAVVASSYTALVASYIYCTEVFPTVVRNSAIGFASMAARVGSMIAPFVVELHDVATWLTPFVFAILPLIAIFSIFLLPETKNCELTTTIEEGEEFGNIIHWSLIR